MGALTSRQNAGADEIDVASIHAYKYPPKSGNYFGSHFIMGGERFDTPQPEAYLFGENADLNFLGSRPSPFPYPPPQANEPTKTLKSLVNMRKESLRLVKVTSQPAAKGEPATSHYNIEFLFDSDAPTTITIYYFATEEITPNGVVFTCKDPRLTSSPYSFKKGANQLFCRPTHDPSQFPEEDLSYSTEKEMVPVAVHCVAHDPTQESRQSHTTIAVIERHSDGTFILKALKQKIFVDGLSYLLQEIYGIENKSQETVKCGSGCGGGGGSDVETEDNGSECVICMCDPRDTLILPCRHLCLCNSCADSLRYQANNCPICRAPFRALLQIRALQRVTGSQATAATIAAAASSVASAQQPQQQQQQPPSTDERCDHVPAGYEGVSLLEALNGPCLTIQHTHTTPDSSNPSSLERTSARKKCRLAEAAASVTTENEDGDDEEEEDEDEEDRSTATEVRIGLPPREEDPLLRRADVKSGGGNSGVCCTPEEEVDSEAEKLSPLLSGSTDKQRSASACSGSGSVILRRSLATGDQNSCNGPLSASSTRRSVEAIAKRASGELSSPSLEESTPSSSSVIKRNGVIPSPSSTEIQAAATTVSSVGSENSDYYNAEDPASTSILGPLHSSDKVVECVGSLPLVTS